ncbi:MAG TPA: hypothetical protein VG738_09935 [Chitinophagaceae bacterium]|nr:hypothetical protein [Chitinophagaceae bacterium]
MKTANTPAQHNYRGKHERPQNKDDMDSRENEEQDFKKTDSTHNKKEVKTAHLHKHHK